MYVLIHHFQRQNQGFSRHTQYYNLAVHHVTFEDSVDLVLSPTRPGWVSIRCRNEFYVTLG